MGLASGSRVVGVPVGDAEKSKNPWEKLDGPSDDFAPEEEGVTSTIDPFHPSSTSKKRVTLVLLDLALTLSRPLFVMVARPMRSRAPC